MPENENDTSRLRRRIAIGALIGAGEAVLEVAATAAVVSNIGLIVNREIVPSEVWMDLLPLGVALILGSSILTAVIYAMRDN